MKQYILEKHLTEGKLKDELTKAKSELVDILKKKGIMVREKSRFEIAIATGNQYSVIVNIKGYDK